MSYLGAGLLVGAATAVTKKLSNKEKKEEARYAFLKEAVEKGESEFETDKTKTLANVEELYADTKDWVQSNIANSITKTEGADNTPVYKGTLDLLESMGVNVYTKINGKKVLNPDINKPDIQKNVVEGLTKIGLAKLVNAQRSGNFDISSAKHRHAILDVRLGGPSAIKASVLRDDKENIINESIMNDGFDLGQYSEPIAKKVGLGKRISNFFNAADDDELLNRIAKERGISIDAARRLVSAGQTEEMDAFQPGSLEENLGSRYGDLPDVSLSNVSTLIPSDRDTIAKQESYIMSLIADSPQTIINASYQNPDLPEMPNNIQFDAESKLFTGKDGKPIPQEQIDRMYKGYLSYVDKAKIPEGNIETLLPEYDPSTGMHRNDSRNLTSLMKRYALLFEASRGKDTQNVMERINAKLEELNLPGISNQFSNDNQYVQSFVGDNNHLVDVKSFTFGFKGSRPDQRKTSSEFLYEIMSDLAKDGVAAEDIPRRAHIILQRYLTLAAKSPQMKL